ncbi:unnamed protein product [Didymodactylos carnosus]|uniref:Uncharacterized protein n=1 Tax=Didymodactylos carnosus TaxID=1234261 RepID=A0A8S2GWX8_9BILA|nr:unnamed protein product [Didymodactylos carnosus]CAF3571679.1 unnamed protein product [Didymodactylos carnosus]
METSLHIQKDESTLLLAENEDQFDLFIEITSTPKNSVRPIASTPLSTYMIDSLHTTTGIKTNMNKKCCRCSIILHDKSKQNFFKRLLRHIRYLTFS